MLGILRSILPEKMSTVASRSFARGPARFFFPLYRMIAREVAAVAQGTLLDIGTGPGILPLETGTLRPGVRIVGMDISETMIDIAKENKKKYALKNVSFLIMHARALSFKDNTLDMIMSTDALHHWKQPVKILNEMYRCLKPGCEAWVYDGFSGVSNEDIDTFTSDVGGLFSLHPLVRLLLGIHGFSQKEYDTTVKDMVAMSHFKRCECEKHGIMMRLCLRK
jgi:ubiquinone/menaquinone biosynthesis C-methylase UbiE